MRNIIPCMALAFSLSATPFVTMADLILSGNDIVIGPSEAAAIENETSGNVYLEATTGNILDNVSASVAGNLFLSAAGYINLDQVNVNGFISGSSQQSTNIETSSFIYIGEFYSAGDLSMTAQGSITDSGAITANNISFISQPDTGGLISLDNNLSLMQGLFIANTGTVNIGGALQVTIDNVNNINSLLQFDAAQTNLDGTLEIAVADSLLLQDGDTINLFNSTGTINYNFSQLLFPELGNGLKFSAENLSSDGIITVMVPEPSTLWLFSIGLISLALGHRRFNFHTNYYIRKNRGPASALA